MARTGTFFGGLIQDVKRRGKVYLSDFRDGFNLHTLLASLFLYFALFATNIAFGGLFEDKTEGWLGLTEVIFAACACSILFGLFGGQPIMIIGATGPMLVFEQSIYEVNICPTIARETLNTAPTVIFCEENCEMWLLWGSITIIVINRLCFEFIRK